MKSSAIVFREQGAVDTLQEEVGPPLPGALLIQTEKTLISAGTELTALDRRFEDGTGWDNWVKYPFRPGYSNVGKVVAIGPDVAGFAPGDRVFTRAVHAQYVTFPAEGAVKVPADVDTESAIWAGIGKIVQNGVRRAQHKLGDAVVVVGLGMLGQLAVQYARLTGPRELIAIDTVEKRRDWAAAHGATHPLPGPAAECLETVRALTNGALADVVYDVTGNAATLAQVLPLARPLGTVVLLGDTGYPSTQCLSQYLVTGGLTLAGAHDSNPAPTATVHTPWSHTSMTELFLHYLARGQMEVRSMITHRFPYTQAANAYALLRDNRAESMGVILEWQ